MIKNILKNIEKLPLAIEFIYAKQFGHTTKND
jgi:hypothetical protein